MMLFEVSVTGVVASGVLLPGCWRPLVFAAPREKHARATCVYIAWMALFSIPTLPSGSITALRINHDGRRDMLGLFLRMGHKLGRPWMRW
jgi:hypothetical protein